MRPRGTILWINSIRPSPFGAAVGVDPRKWALWFWNDDIVVYWPDPQLTTAELPKP